MTNTEVKLLNAANAALDRATDEVLSNCGADTGRWIALCAGIESREDFNEFPANAWAPPAQVQVAAAVILSVSDGVGLGRPSAFSKGASSEGAR
jgi:hypothetical protein